MTGIPHRMERPKNSCRGRSKEPKIRWQRPNYRQSLIV